MCISLLPQVWERVTLITFPACLLGNAATLEQMVGINDMGCCFLNPFLSKLVPEAENQAGMYLSKKNLQPASACLMVAGLERWDHMG